MNRTATIVAALATGLSLLDLPARAQSTRPKETAALLERGDRLYREHCVACHGVKGDGNGPGAYILAQPPRNFTLGVFKFRSTRSGAAPTDSDLFRTVTTGLAGETGAMMPSFAALPEADRWALVAVVKRFAGITKPPAPIRVPPEPATRDLALGARVYERLQCGSCHGDEGRGDGSSSLTLKDDQKIRIWTPDLTRGLFKRGETPAEVFLSMATGLDGTPMPSYADKATANELWALTHYILWLGSKNASPGAERKK